MNKRLSRTPEQLAASNPDAHVWVSASAGTGKTQVLTDRMLRLMLAGSDPDRLLALTFTKAAAAEMQNRLTRRLGEWVRLSDQELSEELSVLDVAASDAMLRRARSLFARALEVPGGLRIQTIHGFAQSLLAGFPAEAGLPVGFNVLEEREAAQLRRRALAEMLADAEREGDALLLEDLSELSTEQAEGTIRKSLDTMLRYAEGMSGFGSTDALEPALRRLIGLAPDADRETMMRRALDDFPLGALRGLADALERWNTRTGLLAAIEIRRWLGCDTDERHATFRALRTVVLTQDGTVRSFRGADKKVPEVTEYIETVGAYLLEMDRQAQLFEVLARAIRYLRAGHGFVARYRQLKRDRVAIDYDDMIAVSAALLGEAGMPSWVAWKLDQRFDHILVDEAQDTNDRQWTIVRRLAEDFFDPDGERRRSLFVVGDYKQAIYGFQGTDPRLFEREREATAARAAMQTDRLHVVPLDRSFRSGPAILELVDLVLADIGPQALGMTGGLQPHIAHRQDAPSEVTLLPLVTIEEEGAEDNQEAAEREMARRLARQVAAWLTVGGPERLWLPARGRWAHAGDILILVRRRSKLMTGLVGALHREGVPVAGVDRLLLTEPYAVLDLLLLMRFSVLPDDDVVLSSLLVSPFLTWTHEEVRIVGKDRKGSLWRALREAAASDPRAGQAVDFLSRLLSMADFRTPYHFLDEALSGTLDCRRKLLERLGPDATQSIDELLTQALAFERGHAPSLEAFLDWLGRDGAEVKRDPDAAAHEVRLMTVHGSKGLEAPVVILADAALKRQTRGDGFVPARPLGNSGDIPVFHPGIKYLPPSLMAVHEDLVTAGTQEDLRLLYVALTRAADQLYVGGFVGGSRAPSPDDMAAEEPMRWWARVRRALLSAAGAEEVAMENWGSGTALRLRRGVFPDSRTEDVVPDPAHHVHAINLRLDRAQPPPRPPRPLTPSAAVEGPADGPAPSGRRHLAGRGRLVHGLIERLGRIAPGERSAWAVRWLRARGAGDESEALAAETLGLFADPAFAAIFSPEALVEAPLAGIVGERVVSGTVDRLIVEPDRIYVVDFKTGHRIPQSVEYVPADYYRQMAAYRALLRQAFSGRRVEAALVYTHGPKLFLLPDKLLDRHAPA